MGRERLMGVQEAETGIAGRQARVLVSAFREGRMDAPTVARWLQGDFPRRTAAEDTYDAVLSGLDRVGSSEFGLVDALGDAVAAIIDSAPERPPGPAARESLLYNLYRLAVVLRGNASLAVALEAALERARFAGLRWAGEPIGPIVLQAAAVNQRGGAALASFWAAALRDPGWLETVWEAKWTFAWAGLCSMQCAPEGSYTNQPPFDYVQIALPVVVERIAEDVANDLGSAASFREIAAERVLRLHVLLEWFYNTWPGLIRRRTRDDHRQDVEMLLLLSRCPAWTFGVFLTSVDDEGVLQPSGFDLTVSQTPLGWDAVSKAGSRIAHDWDRIEQMFRRCRSGGSSNPTSLSGFIGCLGSHLRALHPAERTYAA